MLFPAVTPGPHLFIDRNRGRGEREGGYGFVSLLRSAAPACAVQLISNNFRALAACKTV